MPDTVIDLPAEQPSLAARILLLSIEQSQANWLGQADKSKELGEKMIEEIKSNTVLGFTE